MEAGASTAAPPSSTQTPSVLGKRDSTELAATSGGGGSEVQALRLPEGGDEPDTKEQLEEARRLLDLAMRELEATRAAAIAQTELFQTRLQNLEEQLRVARHERDQALAQAKVLSEGAARGRAPEPPSPSTTLLGGFETPSRQPSPSPSAQIAHQLADVRNQLELIRQQRVPGGYPPGTSAPPVLLPSRLEELGGEDVARKKARSTPLQRFPSPAPDATLAASPSIGPLPFSMPAQSFQPPPPVQLENPPRSRFPFQPPPSHFTVRPEPNVTRVSMPEPPGFALPRQGELLRTIERAAPLLNILMLGSLGPLPRWKNPPYASRPPPVPSLLRNVPPAPLLTPLPAPTPLAEAPRVVAQGGKQLVPTEVPSLHARSPHPQSLEGHVAPPPQTWQYVPPPPPHPAAGIAQVSQAPPRPQGEMKYPHFLERSGQSSKQQPPGSSQSPHRRT